MCEEPTMITHTKKEAGHIQIIGKCGMHGHDEIRKAIREELFTELNR